MKTRHGFGRLPSPPDPRDYLMSAAVRELEKLPRPARRWHSDGPVLDQGETSACVGFAWAGWGISAPVEDDWGNADGAFIYGACKAIDGDPREGTTVRAGAAVMRHAGRLGTYFWAASVDEALDYLAAPYGAPIVFGTVWTESMMTPGPLTRIIRPTGRIVGGHAWLAIGVDRSYVRLRNSWGRAWGKNGEARIRIVDLKALWRSGGEACAGSELPLAIGGR